MKKTFTILALFACSVAASANAWTYDPTLVGNLEKEVSGSDYHSWDVSGSGLTWTGSNPFSIAVTLDIDSLETTKDYSVFSIKDGQFNGLAAVAIQQGNINFYNWNTTTPQGGSIELSSLNAQKTLTLVISRDSSNNMSLDAYADGNFETAVSRAGRSDFRFQNMTFESLNFGGSSAEYFQNIGTAMPSNANAADFTLLGAGYMTGGVATADQLSTFYADIVPEPATAALGAMLLAGMASRRRRK